MTQEDEHKRNKGLRHEYDEKDVQASREEVRSALPLPQPLLGTYGWGWMS